MMVAAANKAFLLLSFPPFNKPLHSQPFAKKNSTVKKTIKKLKKGKTYYVRVRTFKKVNGVTVYSKWSKKMSVKLK